MPIKHELRPPHLLTGKELDSNALRRLIDTSKTLKKHPSEYSKMLDKKSLAMIFQKPSFRTRLSFSRAIQTLGGTYIESLASNRKEEKAKDLIRVLNNYCDVVMLRIHEDSLLDEMAKYSTIPIINGLSKLYHPCQILSDLLTLEEHFGYCNGLTITYIGDGNNILHSLMLMLPILGITVRYCCPLNKQPKQEILNQCISDFVIKHASIEDSVAQSNAVYTDVWTSMGFEANKTSEQEFQDFQVNEKLMSLAHPNAIFMHCMPMIRGREVSDSLPDAINSVVFHQAANRLHAQKALLLFLNGIMI